MPTEEQSESEQLLRPADGGRILDNRGTNLLGEFLRRWMKPRAQISIASAYFSIGAYRHLRAELEAAGEFRFLYGNPPTEDVLPVDKRAHRGFYLHDGRMSATEALSHSVLARRCERWLGRESSKIRAVQAGGFMHGKMFHIRVPDGEQSAVVGSSNLTVRGLGFGAHKNIELNLRLDSTEARQELLDWFDRLWHDDAVTADIKEELLAELRRLYEHYTPQMLYFKTLFEIFRTELDSLQAGVQELEQTHLYDTAIWKKLYPFQKDGVRDALGKLKARGGCIIADSVGLGKTFEALAIIKYFELRNERVLVLCPKRLEQNWIYYTAYTNMSGNPLETDRFGYSVKAHTDLGRTVEEFNWGNYDLIVIDESHHFRNALPDRTDEDGTIIRRSRYRYLLEDVIKKGTRTKVLMLSATPVNNTLSDLRNQIALITEEQDEAFADLGISSLRSSLAVAQKRFNEWQRRGRQAKKLNKFDLLETLGADFIRLLDAISIARSRRHIAEHYRDTAGISLKFPRRAAPVTIEPATDTHNAISYEDVHRRIGEFGLSIYRPSDYLTSQAKDRRIRAEEERKVQFTQAQRENSLVGMMRVGFLKRLESSVYAFALTLGRTIDKVDATLGKIERYRVHRDTRRDDVGDKFDADVPPEIADDAEEEFGEFVVGKDLEYRLREIDIDRWHTELEADKKTLTSILERAQEVTPLRDGKLQELKKCLNGNPTRKTLVFTAYADTARYLYDNLHECARAEWGIHIALVTGGNGCKATLGMHQFNDILDAFAPISRERSGDGQEEIDILIATDCISEGQNLQDCGVVINYDIHWNPVRLVQRFGRIDRIGSRHRTVQMINFWPKAELDRYLDLTWRVKARMALVDISATQSDDPLQAESRADRERAIENDLYLRDRQLRRLRKEVPDLEEMQEGVALSDLTLDSFRGQLLNFIEANRTELENMPSGMHAVVPVNTVASPVAKSGVIFCLKLQTAGDDAPPRGPNPTHPYFLAFVRDDGDVRYSFASAGRTLSLFSDLCVHGDTAHTELCNAFDSEIENPAGLQKYDKLLQEMTRDIRHNYGRRLAEGLTPGHGRGGIIPRSTAQPRSSDDFELVTWLIIKDKKGG